jgi:hypothetical protein
MRRTTKQVGSQPRMPGSPADSITSRHVWLKLGRRNGSFFGPTNTRLAQEDAGRVVTTTHIGADRDRT